MISIMQQGAAHFVFFLISQCNIIDIAYACGGIK